MHDFLELAYFSKLQSSESKVDVAQSSASQPRKIAEMEEIQGTQIVKVWRARKPQKQAKGHKMGKYVKLNFAIDERLACSLHQVLLLTGCVEKAGKAPRGFLEREAARLLQKFQK